jgi:flagellar basal-body rod protein FlgF
MALILTMHHHEIGEHMDIDLSAVVKASNVLLAKNDMISNNLANINTTGFKRDDIVFDILESGYNEELPLDQFTDFNQGDLKSTGNLLDFAISGDGFFTVDSPEGQLFTRNGHFSISEDGLLNDSFGNNIVGTSGPIQVLGQNGVPGELRITEKGEVLVDGDIINKLLITNFEDNHELEKIGNNLFKPNEGITGEAIETTGITQGFLETANINPVSEMVNLIDMHRQFEATQKVMRTFDEISNNAIGLGDV